MVAPDVATVESHSDDRGAAAKSDGPGEMEPPAAVHETVDEEAEVRESEDELCQAGAEEAHW